MQHERHRKQGRCRCHRDTRTRGEPAVEHLRDDLLGRGDRSFGAPALSFFATADGHRDAERWTYSELVRDITRAANLFSRLGVQRDSVVAYVLPNLPETHFIIWGGEAAGIVCAINLLLEAQAMGELLNASGASVLVTLAPFPGTDLWRKVQTVLHKIPSLQHLVLVDLDDRVRGDKRSAAPPYERSDASASNGARQYPRCGARTDCHP